MCAPLDLSKYSANAYLMLLLVCRRYILWQSGNLAICDKHSRLSSSHSSTGTHLISDLFIFFCLLLHLSALYCFFTQLPLECHLWLYGPWHNLGACSCQTQLCIPVKAAEVYIKILSLGVIKQMQFPPNGVPIVKARTYMIYS